MTQTIRQWLRETRKEHAVNVHHVIAANWPHVQVDHYEKLVGVSDWLQKNVGEEDYLWAAEHFWFTHERDAVMFRLSWNDKALA